jgi:hypothetical protein
MSLLPSRQTQEVNIDFPCPYTQERGGVLTWFAASGITFVQYASNPSGAKAVGIQINDIENVNMTRQPFQQYIRDMDIPFTIVGAATQGEFLTDWVYPVGIINQGDLMYVGPSGMVTNSAALGGQKIGKFLGVLQDDPHTVTMRGLGFSRQYIDPITKALVMENDPANAINLATPGYIKIRFDIGASLR